MNVYRITRQRNFGKLITIDQPPLLIDNNCYTYTEVSAHLPEGSELDGVTKIEKLDYYLGEATYVDQIKTEYVLWETIDLTCYGDSELDYLERNEDHDQPWKASLVTSTAWLRMDMCATSCAFPLLGTGEVLEEVL